MSQETLVQVAPASSVIDRGVMRGADVKARLDMIIDIADHAMKPSIDYGKVPGTDKPSLWQAGADKLCVAFQIAPKIRLIEELGGHEEKTYRVTVVGVHQGAGIELGEGAGECSSNEEKYRFRYSVHDNEWNATPEDRRRLKYKRDGTTIKQIRTSPADVANTVLKMAVKRAKIAMVLSVTGAAAIFTQDVEDLAEELRESMLEADGKPAAETKQPQRKSATGGTATAAKPIPPNAKVVVGVIGKTYGDKKPFAVYIGQQKFTTFDEKLWDDVMVFAGTDHRVKLAYTETVKDGRTYLNAAGISIADAESTTRRAPEEEPPLTADEIFGQRDPGSEG